MPLLQLRTGLNFLGLSAPVLSVVMLSLRLQLGRAIDNGVANTPPRGWCSWQRYRCHIACNDSTSAECFNERLIKETADAMAAGGFRDAGYEYVALE